ncbi:MAG: HAD family hydrolase [Chloroflexi bacterium]|nr:HAD family hydrolase [Chloroflexota bacterium]
MDRSSAPGIVFDLDNTLVHSRIDFRQIRLEIGEVLLTVGLVDTPVITDGPERLSIGELIAIGEEHDAAHGARLGPRMWAIVRDYERQGMSLAEVEPHSVPTLAELRRRGHPTAVLTNNSRNSALEALRKFGMLPYLEPILAREDVPRLKPDPSGLLLARELLAGRAEAVVLVGDSYQDGLAAKRAGIPYIGFRSREDEMRVHEIEPLAVIQDLTELLELV